MYNRLSEQNVLLTNGGAEANFITSWYLLKEFAPRSDLVVMVPNYLQVQGVWQAMGGTTKALPLTMDSYSWSLDIEELKAMIGPRTAAIAVCNPNNPTGAILDSGTLRAISEIAEDHELWVLSDEVYRGAEFDEEETPSMLSFTDRAIVTSSLSKVYGLPGLRLGWAACRDEKIIDGLWAYSDYTSISPSMLSDHLGTIALQPDSRAQLKSRAKTIIHHNWRILEEWLNENDDIFRYIRPSAAAICFPQYNLPLASVELVERLRVEKGVLVAPGDYFGTPQHLRIGFGYSADDLRKGLSRISEFIQTL
jgi:aspartate/methionine/tyrosine aminotransferase